MARELPADIAGLLWRGRGYFTLAEAAAAGVSGDRVRRLVRARRLVAVGKGSYASQEQLAKADSWSAHAIRARGFVAGLSRDVLLAGWSSVAVRRLPTLRPPPELPTAVRPRRTGHGIQRTRYGVVSSMTVPIVHRAGSTSLRAVSCGWTVADLARTAPRPDALVLADAAIRTTPATRQTLEGALQHMKRWQGRERAAWVVEHADARAESPLDTLGRLACIEHGLPVPQSNVWIGDGYPRFRVDHLWPDHWVVAEGDGARKYRDGDDPGQVVAAERERQWYLRRLGLEVVRYDWPLARDKRAELAARFRQVLADHPPRQTPVLWWPSRDPFAA